jgi:diguanylate cyclase (GGDEF)-like protein/PAS domain S-box-containing protein
MPRTLLLIHAQTTLVSRMKLSLADSLDRDLVIESAGSCAHGLARLRTPTLPRVTAMLLGLDLPDSLGLAAFESLRQAAPQCPILIVSGPADEQSAQRAVEQGAEDYILDEDLDNYRLAKAVRNMLARALLDEASFSDSERAEVTLNSIGDAVVSVDVHALVTFLNPVAQFLTGWSAEEALGRPVDEILRITDSSRQHRIVSPITEVIHTGRAGKLAPGCKLVRCDGTEFSIEDSVAPIHDRAGGVTGAVMVFHDVTQAQAISQKMLHLAQHDYLTDLPNRLLLNDRLSQAIIAARRGQQKLAVIFVDLDRFKHVNDSLGHPVGDALLLSIAARLVACVRRSDTVSRQGGDEFVVLLASIAHDKDAGFSAQKLVGAIAQPHIVGEHSLQITLSAGISIYPDDGSDAETLIKNADIAMLHAKDNGRNNFQFFKSNMNERALERQSLESGLRYALERREFLLHYQPKVDFVTQQLTGAEALIRWGAPHRELVSPDDFIPIAEQCGYIVPIGRWVLREACRQSRAWLDANGAPIPIAVNISAVELRSDRFVEHVRAILEETGALPENLEFELTETALMQDPQATIAVLHQLKDMGIRIALDDFGTGYSSLSYLRRFPLDALKIDKSFVHGVCTSPDDAKIVSAVINLGRSFHLQVIAEGVETRAQFLALQEQNCGEGQGYYFRRPIAAHEFTRLLASDLSTTDAA